MALFLSPFISDGDKFYYLPCRFFELAVGGLIGILPNKKQKNRNGFIGNLFALGVVVLFLVGLIGFDFSEMGSDTIIIGETTTESSLILPNSILLLTTVVMSSGVLLYGSSTLKNSKIISFIGKRSYSIFIFHQVILAFYRYSLSSDINILFFVVYVVVVFVLSEISYRFIEIIKPTNASVTVSLIAAFCLCFMSGLVYINAGVVRDVPELNIRMSNINRGMHAEYCDRIYSYNKDFNKDSKKINVLVVGNSFARDWGNILLESEYSDRIDLSYASLFSPELQRRVDMADCLFVFMNKNDVPEYVWEAEQLYGRVWAIGTKSFGQNNGRIYAKRFLSNYYDSSVNISEGYRKLNDRWNDEWGNMYIDMIQPVTNADGSIRVFTDDNKFISQDCRHLTEAGARYYAKLLNIEKYLGLSN